VGILFTPLWPCRPLLTGMDPGSRRFMWSLISSTMKGRSVILTTHSMEECEALCQRIGIMVSGRLKCIGSANHLRQRYGHGYQLDVNVSVDRVNQIKEFVAAQFPGSQVLEHHDSNIKFRIRKDRSLGGIFLILNSHRTSLGITEYSVSEATLEQIFIRFARQQEEETAQAEGMVDTTLLQLDGIESPRHNGGHEPNHSDHVPILHGAQPVVPFSSIPMSSSQEQAIGSVNNENKVQV
jgi:ABC-type glutathione transport system ATPase component